MTSNLSCRRMSYNHIHSKYTFSQRLSRKRESETSRRPPAPVSFPRIATSDGKVEPSETRTGENERSGPRLRAHARTVRRLFRRAADAVSDRPRAGRSGHSALDAEAAGRAVSGRTLTHLANSALPRDQRPSAPPSVRLTKRSPYVSLATSVLIRARATSARPAFSAAFIVSV